MVNSIKVFETLEKKLQAVAEGEEIELTLEEAILYGTDVADHLPEEDCVNEQEG